MTAKKLPKWVRFIATDYNGETYGYEFRPFKSFVCLSWNCDGKFCLLSRTIHECLEWEDSLIKVPVEKEGGK